MLPIKALLVFLAEYAAISVLSTKNFFFFVVFMCVAHILFICFHACGRLFDMYGMFLIAGNEEWTWLNGSQELVLSKPSHVQFLQKLPCLIHLPLQFHPDKVPWGETANEREFPKSVLHRKKTIAICDTDNSHVFRTRVFIFPFFILSNNVCEQFKKQGQIMKTCDIPKCTQKAAQVWFLLSEWREQVINLVHYSNRYDKTLRPKVLAQFESLLWNKVLYVFIASNLKMNLENIAMFNTFATTWPFNI